MRSIWAVAVNTLRQALRMKIAAIFMLLLVVLLPIMGATMVGDGTIKGRMQTFVSYSLSLTSLLLCLLTITASVYSLSSDISQKQIYTVLTKPIRRFQLLLGKLLGIILLDVALLALFSAIIYAITISIPTYMGATALELAELDNEFLTARASLTPAKVDVTGEAARAFEKLEKEGRLPTGISRKKAMDMLIKQRELQRRAAAVGHELIWEFKNIKPLDPNDSLFIRFKYNVSVNPPDLQVYGKWFVGDVRQIGSKQKTPIYNFVRKDAIRTFHEIEVPARAVAEDGYLAIGFFNDPQLNSTIVIFPPTDGLEILYVADNFSANFIRGVLLILFRLIFLACLGALTSSFLSFPVAILFCMVVFFTATISGFIVESFDYLSENVSSIYTYTIRLVLYLLPQFDKFNPVKFLVSARLLSWSVLAKAAGLMVCIKALLSFLLAIWIFTYREVARIIV